MVIVGVVAMSCTVFVVPRSRQNMWTVVAVASVATLTAVVPVVVGRSELLPRGKWYLFA